MVIAPSSWGLGYNWNKGECQQQHEHSASGTGELGEGVVPPLQGDKEHGGNGGGIGLGDCAGVGGEW